VEREVENTIERLSLQHGRVHVSGGFSDGLVRATVPNGSEYFINRDGRIVMTGINRTVDWTRQAA